MEAVDENGKGVMSVLASSLVDEDGNSSPLEVADPIGEVEEDAFSLSVLDFGLGLFESPVIVLKIVVTTFVLVWLPDSDALAAVIVLTIVVTTSLLDWLLCVPGTVVVEVLLTRVLDLTVIEAVPLPPLVLLADTVMPEVVLLRLDAGIMLVVVELVSGSFEVDNAIDEIELDVFWTEVEVVTCVSDAGTEDDIEMETSEMFLLVLCVSVTLVEVDDAAV